MSKAQIQQADSAARLAGSGKFSLKKLFDDSATIYFTICALIVIATLLLVYVNIGSQAYQTFTQWHISLTNLFTSNNWDAVNNFGLKANFSGTLMLVILTVFISAPFSVGMAIFIAEIAPNWIQAPMRGAVELFLGIPSVIFGLLGLIVVVPFVRNVMNSLAGAYLYNGYGIIAAIIIVTFMVLPTITTISIDAIRAVPREIREGSLALGATRWQTIRNAVLPAALPGVMTGVILGVTRALGETVAVAFVIGGAEQFPFTVNATAPFIHFSNGSDVLTTLLLFNFKEATNNTPLYSVLYTISFMLLIISAIMIAISRYFASRRVYR